MPPRCRLYNSSHDQSPIQFNVKSLDLTDLFEPQPATRMPWQLCYPPAIALHHAPRKQLPFYLKNLGDPNPCLQESLCRQASLLDRVQDVITRRPVDSYLAFVVQCPHYTPFQALGWLPIGSQSLTKLYYGRVQSLFAVVRRVFSRAGQGKATSS